MEAEAFVEDVLRRALGAWEVVVGFNHTFGRGARHRHAARRWAIGGDSRYVLRRSK
jgi:FAD synthase